MAAGRDEALMARALRLAAYGLYSTDPNPRVGCVVAQGDRIVGEGWHGWAGGHHAEAIALAEAGDEARGATAYITLEPCCHHGQTPPCTDALIRAGVSRVVCTLRDPDPRVAGKGFRLLEEAGIRVERLHALAGEARALNIGFIKRMTTGRPWIRAKLAMSLDGRTALASGESRWITAEAARADVHRWRARASCILTGSGTVLADDPRLDARLQPSAGGDVAAAAETVVKQPAVAVADSRLRTPPAARLLAADREVIVFASEEAPERAAALRERGAEVITLGGTASGVDLQRLAFALGERAVNEVHVEAGSKLCGSLLAAGLIDELILYMAPQILGADALGAFNIAPLASMAERLSLHLHDVRHVGADLRIRAYPIVDRDHERRS